MNNIIVIIIYIILLTKIIIFYNIYLTNKQNYTKLKNTFERKIEKELSIISSYYHTNKSIKLSRVYTSPTKYDKKETYANMKYDKSKILSKYRLKRAKILIAVHSHISLFYHRHVFRKIYRYYNNIHLLFFIGLNYNNKFYSLLNEEINMNNDIVAFNCMCNYNNLQYLTYNFILWAKKYKFMYDIIIKQDTDTFLNINLLQIIIEKKLLYKTNYIFGRIWNFKNKKNEYPSGMCYLFSSESLEKLSYHINKKYSQVNFGFAEDKFIGYLAREANFSFYDLYYSFNFKYYLQLPDNLIFINNTLLIHSLRISEIAFLYYLNSNFTLKS